MKYLTLFLLVFFTNFLSHAQNQWDIQFAQSSLNCSTNQVCYQLEVQNTMGADWTIGDQNYRFFFDGDLMTVTSVTSLLPAAFYGGANIDQNIKITGQGQETASPLDDIDDNLGFLDFSIVQSDKSNPPGATQLTNGTFTPVAEICVDLDPTVLADNTGSTCVAFYHSRPSTAGGITNQYTVISENDAPSSTIAAMGVNYDDLTSNDGAIACLGLNNPICSITGTNAVAANTQNEIFSAPAGMSNYAWSILSGDATIDGADNNQSLTLDFGTTNTRIQLIITNASACTQTCILDIIIANAAKEWDIQLTLNTLNCATDQVCYQLEVQNTSGADWTLGDQNYRLFFDGDLMTVTSVTSLLPPAFYGNASIDMNTKYSGLGQETASPLDDIDDNLGFLDFNIVQTDKTNPGGATQLTNGTFTPVAEICVDLDPTVLADNTGNTCIAFYHSRPSTAGIFTNQYTTISENDAVSSTIAAMGVNYDDLTSDDGAEACLGLNVPICNITGASSVIANAQNEIFTAPVGMASYSWNVISADASIDGSAIGQNLTVDFGTTAATIELTVTNASGCAETCSVDVTISPPDKEWDIQLTQSNLDCVAEQVCYQLEVQNTSGVDWTIGDQNYRLFFDGDLMTVTSVTSLLPPAFYGNASIDMNTKYSGLGQETTSPLDDIDDNLGFLDFNIVQTDKTNPVGATQLSSGMFTAVAEICVDVDPTVLADNTGNTCIAFYHSRPSTAGTFTNQYTTISENDAAGSTAMATGINYDDLTSIDGADACLGLSCSPANQWNVQLNQSSFSCPINQVCYQLEVEDNTGTDWALADQNYRLFFDGDLMTVVSVTSLLPSAFYGNAIIDMNQKYTGVGQEATSPLDDIDDNLGFLDFNIVQTDKTNPAGATFLTMGIFTPVAEICIELDETVLNDASNNSCVTFYHSRPSTAGTFTVQYTTISENDAVSSTIPTTGVNYDDLTSDDGAEACLSGGMFPDNSLVVSDSTICDLTPAVSFVFGSEIGITYQLRNDADDSALGTPIAGTGNAISFTINNLTPPGTYTYNVLATSNISGCAIELIDKAVITVVTCDFPDFPTPVCSTPACHYTSNDIYLGSGVSSEGSTSGTSTADSDDDDGVLIPNDIRRGITVRFPTTIYNNTGNVAHLAIWVDWNGNSDFEAGEQIAGNSYDPALYNGTFQVSIETQVPSDAIQNQAIPVRFRLSTDNSIIASPCGAVSCAADGEIEDHLIQIECPPIICLPVGITVERGGE